MWKNAQFQHFFRVLNNVPFNNPVYIWYFLFCICGQIRRVDRPNQKNKCIAHNLRHLHYYITIKFNTKITFEAIWNASSSQFAPWGMPYFTDINSTSLSGINVHGRYMQSIKDGQLYFVLLPNELVEKGDRLKCLKYAVQFKCQWGPHGRWPVGWSACSARL